MSFPAVFAPADFVFSVEEDDADPPVQLPVHVLALVDVAACQHGSADSMPLPSAIDLTSISIALTKIKLFDRPNPAAGTAADSQYAGLLQLMEVKHPQLIPFISDMRVL